MGYILGIVVLTVMLALTVMAYMAYAREADRLFTRKAARQDESQPQAQNRHD